MSRISEIEIAGRKYPLNFSVKAASLISARYNGLENIDQAFAEKSVDMMMAEVIWLLSTLMEQGAAYKRLVDGEDVKALTADELEVVLGVADLSGLKDQIMGALVLGMGRTVEVDDNPKNGETTQDK